MKRFFSHLKSYFFPHKGNAYRPHFFSKQSLVAVAALLIFLQIGYFVYTTTVLNTKSSFMAAVLPGVLTALTNSDRQANGVGELTEDPLLKKAAETKAADMAAKGYFSHVTPDGKTPWYWLDQVGYDYTYAGENLAVNFTESKDVEDAWMKSPTHRANIVKGEFTRIGIGTADGMYQGKEATFVVQFFATPAESVATSPIPKPAAPKAEQKTVPATEIATVGTPPTKVLGAEAGPTTPAPKENIKDAVLVAATSPSNTLLYFLGGIIALIVLLLALAVFVKVKVQYLEVIGGGALLLGLAIGSFYLIAETHVSDVSVPSDAQSATVSIRS